MRTILAGAAVLLAAVAAFADTIQLQSGGRVDGVVLQQTEDKVIVHLRHGVVTMNREDVASVTKDESVQKAGGRIAPWTACFRALAARPWGPELRPLPAVIIDGGTFKNIPYTSDRSGSREFNLYGDPDRPAGLEIGLSRELAKNPDARKEALSILKSLLLEAGDREAAASLDPSAKGSKDADGLVIEVDEAQNASGAATCFITAYDRKALLEARVTDKDLPGATPGSEGGKAGSTVAGPASGASSKSASGTSASDSASTDSNFGFSPGALAGEMPKATRTYSTGGANWARWWLMHHPPTSNPKPATSTTNAKPKPGTSPQK